MNKLKTMWLELKSKRVEWGYAIKKAIPASVKRWAPAILAIAFCVILIEELSPSREWLKLSLTLCMGRWIFPRAEKVIEGLLRRL